MLDVRFNIIINIILFNSQPLNITFNPTKFVKIKKDIDIIQSEGTKTLKNTEEVVEEEVEKSDPGSDADDQEEMVFIWRVPHKFRGNLPPKFDDNDKMTHWVRIPFLYINSFH